MMADAYTQAMDEQTKWLTDAAKTATTVPKAIFQAGQAVSTPVLDKIQSVGRDNWNAISGAASSVADTLSKSRGLYTKQTAIPASTTPDIKAEGNIGTPRRDQNAPRLVDSSSGGYDPQTGKGGMPEMGTPEYDAVQRAGYQRNIGERAIAARGQGSEPTTTTGLPFRQYSADEVRGMQDRNAANQRATEQRFTDAGYVRDGYGNFVRDTSKEDFQKKLDDLYYQRGSTNDIGKQAQISDQIRNLMKLNALDVGQKTEGMKEKGALQRTQMQGENQLANTQLSGDLQSGRLGQEYGLRKDEAQFKEGLGSTQAEIEAKRAGIGESSARANLYGLQAEQAQAAIDAAPASARLALMKAFNDAVSDRIKAVQASSVTPLKADQIKAIRDEVAATMFPREEKAEGGIVGYANGGMIQNMGAQPDTSEVLHMARQYQTYNTKALQSGLKPVSFGEFAYMLGEKAVQAMPGNGNQPAPVQMNGQTSPSMGFADGGEVPQEELDKRPKPVGPFGRAFIEGAMAVNRGAGAIGSAIGNAVQSFMPETTGQSAVIVNGVKRYQDGTTEEIKRQGYAEGGAIPVAGKQIQGPGTGKSDSIPAVVDGSRPAALSNGEFVMPVETVKYFGTKALERMVAQSRQATQG